MHPGDDTRRTLSNKRRNRRRYQRALLETLELRQLLSGTFSGADMNASWSFNGLGAVGEIQFDANNLIVSASVVDESGRTVLIMRGDGAGFFSPETSRKKAVAAANFRKPTKELGEQAAKGSPFWAAVPAALAGEILPTIGAVPIIRAGRVIGAIGCGGGTGEQDHECAEAGAAALGA